MKIGNIKSFIRCFLEIKMQMSPSTKRICALGIILLGVGGIWKGQFEITMACVTALGFVLREETSRSVKKDENGKTNPKP